mmetsp:Transcript_20170/g.43229  ORF Transcript_20170/g.43229 Transcript_20170/m.43229 type:complete len:474 (+) Transcript_20170:639-2060(+)
MSLGRKGLRRLPRQRQGGEGARRHGPAGGTEHGHPLRRHPRRPGGGRRVPDGGAAPPRQPRRGRREVRPEADAQRAGGLRSLVLLRRVLRRGSREVSREEAEEEAGRGHGGGVRGGGPGRHRRQAHRLQGHGCEGGEAAARVRDDHRRSPEGGGGARQGHRERSVSHGHLHPGRPRSRGALPLHPRPRGGVRGRVRRRGRVVRQARGSRHPLLHAAVRRPLVHLLSVPEDQPLPQDSRHAGARDNAGRDRPVQGRGGEADLPLHGMFHDVRVHCTGRNILCQDLERTAIGEGVPFRLRGGHRPRRRVEHLQGGTQLQRGRLRPRRGRPGGHPRGEDGGRVPNHRRGRQPRQVPRGLVPRRHGHRGQLQARRAGSEPHRGDDRLGGGLHLRLHRHRVGDARGAGVRPPRVGHVVRDRGGGVGARDKHPSVPARDRADVEGHGVRGVQEPARRPAACPEVHRRRPSGGSLHHAHL